MDLGLGSEYKPIVGGDYSKILRGWNRPKTDKFLAFAIEVTFICQWTPNLASYEKQYERNGPQT